MFPIVPPLMGAGGKFLGSEMVLRGARRWTFSSRGSGARSRRVMEAFGGMPFLSFLPVLFSLISVPR